MKIVTSLRRMIPVTFALGLVIGSAVTPVWSAEAAAASTAPAPAAAEEKVAWADNRALAIGLGAVGGVLAYNLLCSWWGGGMGVRMAQQAAVMPRAAGAGAGLGGGRLMLTASGVAGALVGDWFYRSKQTDSAARK